MKERARLTPSCGSKQVAQRLLLVGRDFVSASPVGDGSERCGSAKGSISDQPLNTTVVSQRARIR